MRYSLYTLVCCALSGFGCGGTRPSSASSTSQARTHQHDVCNVKAPRMFEASEQGNFELIEDLQSRIESCCEPLEILNEESCVVHAQSVNVSDDEAYIERVQEGIPCLNEAALACVDELMALYRFSPAPRSEIETEHCSSPFEACTKERAEAVVLLPLQFKTKAYKDALSQSAREASEDEAALSKEVDAVLDTLPARE